MIKLDMTKAQAIAHDIRRNDRAEKLRPHDEVIALNLPNVDLVAEEAARQAIRDANALVQTDIDNATTEVELKASLAAL